MGKLSGSATKNVFFLVITTVLTALLYLIIFPGVASLSLLVDEFFYDQFVRAKSFFIDPRDRVYPYLTQVSLTDEDIQERKLTRWNRQVYSEIISALTELNVHSIGLDIIFQNPGEDLLEDTLLVTSVEAAGNVYLPVLPHWVGGDDNQSQQKISPFLWNIEDHFGTSKLNYKSNAFITPFDELLVAGKGVGHIFTTRENWIVRDVPLIIQSGRGFVPSLSFAMVCDYLQVKSEDITVIWGRDITLANARMPGGKITDLVIPIDYSGAMRISVPAPWGTSANLYDFSTILNAIEDVETRYELMDEIEDSMVIISDISVWSKDTGPGILDDTYPLSIIHSRMMNTIIMEDFYYHLNVMDRFYILLFVFILPFVVLGFLKLTRSGIIVIAGVVLCCIIQIGAFVFFNIIPFLFLPLFTMLLSSSSTLLYRYIIRKKEACVEGERIDSSVSETVTPYSATKKTGSDDNTFGHAPGRNTENIEIQVVLPQESEKLSRKKIYHPEVFETILGSSVIMNHLCARIEEVAGSCMPVLITGETGVGKNQIPRTIHELSGRTGDLVTVNIAGLDDNMFSDTLFGHEKGAFTGAHSNRSGLIEQARGGTLFLDEIGDLEPASQVKLLDLIQNNRFYPLGSDQECTADVRIVAATNAVLKDKIREDSFREDLFYRFTYQLVIPPLRGRFEDLPSLVDHFFEEAARDFNKIKPAIPEELVVLLKTYPFPGNIRELQRMVFEAMSRHKSKTLSLSFFKEYISIHKGKTSAYFEDTGQNRIVLNYSGSFPSIKETTEILVDEALKKSEGKQSIAANMLGITPSALSKRLKGKYRKETKRDK